MQGFKRIVSQQIFFYKSPIFDWDIDGENQT